MSQAPGAASGLVFGAGLSGAEDAESAGVEAAERAGASLSACDAVFVAISAEHAPHAERVVERVARRLQPGVTVGVSAEGVVAGAVESLGGPGVAVLAMRLPGVRVGTFTDHDLTLGDDAQAVAQMRRALGVDPELRAVVVLADAYSVPVGTLLGRLNAVLHDAAGSAPVLVGGVASSGRAPGQNVVIGPDGVRRRGLVGLTLSGAIEVSALVSQGCRPVGPKLVITKARRNVVLELGGRPALEAIRAVARELDGRTRELLSRGVLLGIVVDEFKAHVGRGDFLIRNVVRADQQTGAIVVTDQVRVGQTARVHVRDAETASEDLSLLLDAQKLHGPPAGVLLVTCNGRGRRLFDTPHHDARALQRAFGQPEPGEALAKSGEPIEVDQRAVPLAGFFAAGEIGPIGNASFLHAHTACALLLRQAR